MRGCTSAGRGWEDRLTTMGLVVVSTHDRDAEDVSNLMLCLVKKSNLHVERMLIEEEADAVKEPLSDRSSAKFALVVLREARKNRL